MTETPNQWTPRELELVLDIADKREWLRYADAKRQALPTAQLRESAHLGDFLNDHRIVWLWFIHEDCGIPICGDWRRDTPNPIDHAWEVRSVHNDVMVGVWRPYPEAGYTTATLTKLLRSIYRRDPELGAAGFSDNVFEDYTHRFQYRLVPFVSPKLPKKDPENWINQTLATGE